MSTFQLIDLTCDTLETDEADETDPVQDTATISAPEIILVDDSDDDVRSVMIGAFSSIRVMMMMFHWHHQHQNGMKM